MRWLRHLHHWFMWSVAHRAWGESWRWVTDERGEHCATCEKHGWWFPDEGMSEGAWMLLAILVAWIIIAIMVAVLPR